MPKRTLNASKKTKHTTAGKIPVDWGWSGLEHVATIQTGLSKSAARKGEFVSMPYLRVANVQDGHFNLSEIKEINVPVNSVERFSIKRGDVLLTEGGDFNKLGRGAIWNGQIDPCVHQNHIFVVRPNQDRLDTRFFSYQTSSSRGRAYFQSCSKQSTNLASINSSQLKQFPALLPPLPEQRKIANILEAWDSALEKLDALTDAKTRRKQALMQQLLAGKKRLPGFTGEWKTSKLSELVEVPRKTPVASSNTSFAITVKLHCKGIDRSKRQNVKITQTGRPYYQRYAGEILIGRQNFHNGGVGIVPNELDGGIASNAITSLSSKRKKLCSGYLLHVFTHPNFYKRVGHTMDGTGQKEISEKRLLKLQISIPSIKEQTAIAEALDTADAELNLLKKQRIALEQQKRGLMQQLLTGKVRVKV